MESLRREIQQNTPEWREGVQRLPANLINLCEGDTLLHVAARYDNMDAVSLLLEKGADLRLLNDQGETPEQVAREARNLEVAAYLASQKIVVLLQTKINVLSALKNNVLQSGVEAFVSRELQMINKEIEAFLNPTVVEQPNYLLPEQPPTKIFVTSATSMDRKFTLAVA